MIKMDDKLWQGQQKIRAYRLLHAQKTNRNSFYNAI